MYLKKIFPFLVISGLIFSFFSCEPCENGLNTGNQVILKFEREVIEGEDTTITDLDTAFHKIIAIGVTDSLYKITDTTATFTLPLKADANSTTYIFEKDGVEEILVLNYSVTQNINSPDCGVDIQFTNLSVDATSTLPNILVLSSEINTSSDVNVSTTYK